MEFDAVIVGAGHNALAAAVHLASRGWTVGVFERNDTAGGAVRSAEVTLPGFRHDLYAMNLSLFAGSPSGTSPPHGGNAGSGRCARACVLCSCAPRSKSLLIPICSRRSPARSPVRFAMTKA